MTGDGNGDGVFCTRTSNRSHGSRCADLEGDVRVSGCLAGGDFAYRLPHPLLKRSPSDVERQFQPISRLLDKIDHPRHQIDVVSIPAFEIRTGKSVLQFLNESIPIFSDQDRHHALFAGCDQNRSQRRLTHCKSDSFAQRPDFFRRVLSLSCSHRHHQARSLRPRTAILDFALCALHSMLVNLHPPSVTFHVGDRRAKRPYAKIG